MSDNQNPPPPQQPDFKPRVAAKASAPVDLEKGKTYFFCTCGLSEKQPFCDGKHKGTGYKSLGFSATKDQKAFLCQCKQSLKTPFCDGTHKSLPDET